MPKLLAIVQTAKFKAKKPRSREGGGLFNLDQEIQVSSKTS